MKFDPVMEFSRPKILRILNSEEKEMHRILAPIYFLYAHLPPVKLLACLDWLIENKLLGKKFLAFFAEECGDSNLELVRFLLQKVEQKDKSRLLAGKDMII